MSAPAPTSFTPRTAKVVQEMSAKDAGAASPAAKPEESLVSRSLKEAGAGVAGSIFSAFFTYPIDFVKTRLQVPGCPYTGAIDGIQRIAREEGPLTLYRGFSSEIYKGSLQNFIYFFSYTSLKEMATRPEEKGKDMSFHKNMAVGILAGCLTQMFVNPLSVVQTRLMTQAKAKGVSDSVLGTAASIVRKEGVGALYSGIVPAFILTSNPAIQFVVFDRLKAWWVRYLKAQAKDGEKARAPSAFEVFIIGSIAKAVATVVTYPYIMAKVRLQWKPAPGQAAPAVKYTGALDVMMKTIQNEGIIGLYTGLQPQLLKSVLGSALMFMAKEKVQEYSDMFVRLVGYVLYRVSGGAAGSNLCPWTGKPCGPKSGKDGSSASSKDGSASSSSGSGSGGSCPASGASSGACAGAGAATSNGVAALPPAAAAASSAGSGSASASSLAAVRPSSAAAAAVAAAERRTAESASGGKKHQ